MALAFSRAFCIKRSSFSEDIDDITQQNAALAEEVSTLSANMVHQAAAVVAILEVFAVEDKGGDVED
ncbi:hypothetical protein [Grimontia sp. NTOU-MAR1]|uniref:hypothetical protein n=1 Tax=Grimontia sp. NTOU-MAR1 TaxID=3111011 RepID=UPI002DBDE6F6|nr:hypothetical protein [Grimontia sp. NTOU-MAR1]WRV98707.1 hypothetical protein VP504_04520 [Grimontia sp. NTOU-MAR1]